MNQEKQNNTDELNNDDQIKLDDYYARALAAIKKGKGFAPLRPRQDMAPRKVYKYVPVKCWKP